MRPRHAYTEAGGQVGAGAGKVGQGRWPSRHQREEMEWIHQIPGASKHLWPGKWHGVLTRGLLFQPRQNWEGNSLRSNLWTGVCLQRQKAGGMTQLRAKEMTCQVRPGVGGGQCQRKSRTGDELEKENPQLAFQGVTLLYKTRGPGGGMRNCLQPLSSSTQAVGRLRSLSGL